MNKKEREKFFEEWLRAYTDHLHLLGQGPRVDLVKAPDSAPPVSVTESGATLPHSKPTNS
jgi:hypothetical protein